jgi:hypothetical protein
MDGLYHNTPYSRNSSSNEEISNASDFPHAVSEEGNEMNKKERKASIKAHSDKTKDMPRSALIAFATFYNFENCPIERDVVRDNFDVRYKNVSLLTKLEFRLKKDALRDNIDESKLIRRFSVTLYPNSVFMIPLRTNRLYTHEIKPASLPADKIPTRLGYVVRCSRTRSVFTNGNTFIEHEDKKRVPLHEMSEEEANALRSDYFKENTTTDVMNYGDLYSSMNRGDYLKPVL